MSTDAVIGEATGAPSALRVLRLCSVFEPDRHSDVARMGRFDGFGGMQNHTAALTRALDRAGVSQTVVTSRLGGRADRRPLGERSEVVRLGVAVRSARQLWWAGALRRLADQRPVDVVHAHQGEDLALLPLAAATARRYRCPLVVTVHCSVRHTVRALDARTAWLRAIGGPAESAVLRRADAVIALTGSAARRLTGEVDARRLHVIPSGVEPSVWTIPDEMTVEGPPVEAARAPTLAFVGRLGRQKSVPTLVEAFGLVRTPDARLLIVGDGPDHQRVDDAIAGLAPGARRRLERRGFVEHHLVPPLLREVDVLVLPSAYEELGSILLEAMHAGVAVVATDVGGIPDVVSDGRTGLLVPPGRPDLMAGAVDRLLGDAQLRLRLAAAARVAAGGYSWDHLAQQVLGVYGKVVE